MQKRRHDLKLQIEGMPSLSAENGRDELMAPIQSPHGCMADERQINAGTTFA
jgi:hypothetical protein